MLSSFMTLRQINEAQVGSRSHVQLHISQTKSLELRGFEQNNDAGGDADCFINMFCYYVCIYLCLALSYLYRIVWSKRNKNNKADVFVKLISRRYFLL